MPANTEAQRNRQSQPCDKTQKRNTCLGFQPGNKQPVIARR